MKQPAPKLVEQYKEMHEIDRIALPLIPKIGIAAAYLRAMRLCASAKKDQNQSEMTSYQ